MTGWPPGLLQDDSKRLSKWLAYQPNAKQLVRERCAEIEDESMHKTTHELINEIRWYITANGGENPATHLLTQAAKSLQQQAHELASVGAGSNYRDLPMNDKDEMIDKFERHFSVGWDHPSMRTERTTWAAAWGAAKSVGFAGKAQAAINSGAASEPCALEVAEKLLTEWVSGNVSCETANEAAEELRRQHVHIAALEAQIEAVGAGGVESLRKSEVVATQVAHGEQCAHCGEGKAQHNGLRCVNGKERCYFEAAPQAAPMAYPIDADPQGIRAAVAEAITGALAFGAQGNNPPPEGHWLAPFWNAAKADAAALVPAPPILAADHNGMRVDYQGLLGQCQRTLSRHDPGTSEMLRQLQGHLQELGRRWYAGDASAVDEFLQLYCIEHNLRTAIATIIDTQGDAA